jgi:anti-sigma factor RsiW
VNVDRNRLEAMIQADLDGELNAAERAELARLLLQDPEARRLHEEFWRMDRMLRDVPRAEPPHGLRAAIHAGSVDSVRRGEPRRAQGAQPFWRLAAVVVAGLLVAGVSYLLLDAGAPGSDLQGSLGRADSVESVGRIAAQDRLSLRAEGVEVDATLSRNGERLSLELDLTTNIPCEVVARIDPATTAFLGSRGDSEPNVANGQVVVQLESGRRVFALDFSGTAPIALQLRSAGRVLAEGRLSVSD